MYTGLETAHADRRVLYRQRDTAPIPPEKPWQVMKNNTLKLATTDLSGICKESDTEVSILIDFAPHMLGL